MENIEKENTLYVWMEIDRREGSNEVVDVCQKERENVCENKIIKKNERKKKLEILRREFSVPYICTKKGTAFDTEISTFALQKERNK